MRIPSTMILPGVVNLTDDIGNTVTYSYDAQMDLPRRIEYLLRAEFWS